MTNTLTNHRRRTTTMLRNARAARRRGNLQLEAINRRHAERLAAEAKAAGVNLFDLAE